MKSPKTRYVCNACGQQQAKWMGRCPECSAWNSIAEERAVTGGGAKRRLVGAAEGELAQATPIGELAQTKQPRISTGVEELDAVLGGGLVPGSVVLLGGEPGVGKSTLLLQVAHALAKSGHRTLYVSGEESTSQTAARAERLGVDSPELFVLAETSLEAIRAQVEKLSPALLVLDSIQTTYSDSLESQPGSVGQLRECTFALAGDAKNRSMATFLVGHVTKEGAIAGPKLLEHMVDVVLYFESTSSQNYRIVRGIKNRFGSTNEIAVFEMRQDGIREVRNPSELFLAERPDRIAGSVVTASVEGTRSYLVEVQALVSGTALAMPRRTAIGIDSNRLALLVAILEKRGGYRLYDQDVYLNVAGGMKLTEPAVDLAVVAALLSSFTNKVFEGTTLFFGEVGLGGEVRSVPKAQERLREASRIGFQRAFVPAKAAAELRGDTPLEIIGVEHVGAIADAL